MIRIGTVVTKDNFNKLEEIGILLRNYDIDVWKLYQFTPQGVNALKYRESLEIVQKKFDEVAENIKNIFSPFYKVIVSKREDRTRAYFFINPDGTVLVPVDDRNICRPNIIGNIFDKDIFSKWRSIVSKDNYLSNATITFDYKF
jgi:MoaA/NifB/PqqE/SkfB family radical SAM enzyme